MTAGIDFDPIEREAIAAEVNLSVLRRSDSAVKSILKSASHVALYELKDDSSWRRCDIEGSLFIVERTPEAQGCNHRLVIFNRKSLHNYTDDLIIGNKKVEQTDQMIMYRNSHGATVGIWFYETDEAAATFAILQKILNGEHVPAETTPKPKRVMKRPQSQQQKAPPQKPTPHKSPQRGPQKGSATRPAQQKAPAKRGPGHRASYKPASHKDSAARDNGQKDHVQKTHAQREPVKPKTIMTKPKKNSPGQASGTGTDVSTPENALKQIFPNLQLPDGISEHAPSDSAQELSPVEAEHATTFKPTAEIDGAILRASETELPEKALSEAITETKGNEADRLKETGEKAGGKKGGTEKRSEEQKKEGGKVAKEPTAIVEPAQVMRAIESVETSGTEGQKPQRQIQIKKRPKEKTNSSGERGGAKWESKGGAERGSNEKGSGAGTGTHERDEAKRRMQAAMHEGRYRDMGGFGYNAGNDVAVSGPIPMMGGAMGGGHFAGGVHPQLAMMMHQHQYQMYMQQQQYLANVHQRQLQPQQQRYLEHMQEMQRQAQHQAQAQQQAQQQQQQQQQQQPQQGQHVRGEVEPAQELMRMLRVGETSGASGASAASAANSNERDIGRSISRAEKLGQVGTAPTAKLDRPSFRAVVQRMLTDRKLFDSVYEHYLSGDL